jgi:hypothetical protein
VNFAKGQRKDDIAHEYLADRTGTPPLQAASRSYNTALENLSRTTLLVA